MSDKEEIEQVRSRYEACCNDGDLKTWLTTLTDDAVILAPGSPVVSGSEIEAWAAETFFDPFDMTVSLEDDEVQVMGEWAFVRGHFSLSVTPKGGGDTQEDRGKYLDLLRRQSDGSWKYARLAWNSDSAA